MLKQLTVTLLLASLSSLSLPVQAAQQFTDYESAKARATSTGYIVFIYPAGWDRYSEKICRKLIADADVRRAAGDAALLLAPIYQNRNDANNAEAQKAMGALAYPGDMSDISYPAIVFYEQGGRQYSTIHGRELMSADAAQVAELIRQRLSAKKEQDSLLSRANAATDPAEKARYLLESTRVSGPEWPDGLKQAMQQADPDDKSGYLAVLDFGFAPQENEAMEDFLKRLDSVLDNPRYTEGQKQRVCAAAIGHIRRSLGTRAGGSLITKYATIMHKLDPDSPLGLSAPVVMRDWVQEYRYGQGWSPEVLPGNDTPLLMLDVPINKPGIYTVTFKIVTGRDAVQVKKLRLMDGSRCIVEDNTPRDITWSATRQSYILIVKKALKNPALEITYGNAPDKRSTWGEITVKKN